jgi:cyd operon protein YbgT
MEGESISFFQYSSTPFSRLLRNFGDLKKCLFSNKGAIMWYFAWILGVLLACAFGIINVMWMETEEMLGTDKDKYVSLADSS